MALSFNWNPDPTHRGHSFSVSHSLGASPWWRGYTPQQTLPWIIPSGFASPSPSDTLASTRGDGLDFDNEETGYPKVGYASLFHLPGLKDPFVVGSALYGSTFQVARRPAVPPLSPPQSWGHGL